MLMLSEKIFAQNAESRILVKIPTLIAKQNNEQTLAPDSSSIKVFGLTLSSPFLLKECKYKHNPADDRYTQYSRYIDEKTEICFEYDETKKKGNSVLPVNDKVYITWPRNGAPKIAALEKLKAKIIEGNLESIEFETAGLLTQEEDYKALTEKFGNASTVTPMELKNQYGSKREFYRAEWKLPNAHVFYDAINEEVYKVLPTYQFGIVIIETNKAQALRNSADKNLPKL